MLGGTFAAGNNAFHFLYALTIVGFALVALMPSCPLTASSHDKIELPSGVPLS